MLFPILLLILVRNENWTVSAIAKHCVNDNSFALNRTVDQTQSCQSQKPIWLRWSAVISWYISQEKPPQNKVYLLSLSYNIAYSEIKVPLSWWHHIDLINCKLGPIVNLNTQRGVCRLTSPLFWYRHVSKHTGIIKAVAVRGALCSKLYFWGEGERPQQA